MGAANAWLSGLFLYPLRYTLLKLLRITGNFSAISPSLECSCKMWTIPIVPLAAIPVKAVSDAKPRKAKPKNEHQGRMSLYVDGLSVHALILKQEMLVVAIVEATYSCVDFAKFAQSSAITPKLRKYREK